MEKKRVVLQDVSPGWSDSVTPGMYVVISVVLERATA